MIAQGRWQATPYALSLKASSLSVAIQRDTVIVYDLAGRLYSVYRAGRHHRRSLSGPILQKWTTGERQRRWLTGADADHLIDWAADQLRLLAQALRQPDWEWLTPPDHPSALDELLTVIERAAHFDSAAARLDAAGYADVYHPIGMLPPDQYLALVLQATDGCSFNTCTFCDLYHQPFRVKTPAEFRLHIERVRAYLGESLRLRQRSIFLGAANALAIPMSRLVPILEIIAEEFSPSSDPLSLSAGRPAAARTREGRGARGEGIYAFLDAFTGIRKSVSDYRMLAALGLRRVYIGLESGHDPLLEFVRKPSRARDAIETVQALKAAGIQVGVIVMIGLGGDYYAEGHVADTVRVLNAMPLGVGDMLYLSDLVEEPGTPYPILAAQIDLQSLNASQLGAQRAALRHGLQLPGVKISHYDVREFVY